MKLHKTTLGETVVLIQTNIHINLKLNFFVSFQKLNFKIKDIILNNTKQIKEILFKARHKTVQPQKFS